MLQKNKEKKERKERRHAFIGRPVRFDKKTKYDRKKQKENDRKEVDD